MTTTPTPETTGFDLNLLVICGRLAADPEFNAATEVVRFLVTVRTEVPRRRVDVIPVTVVQPTVDVVEDLAGAVAGDRVFVFGAVQRRVWDLGPGREDKRSRLEFVAEQIHVKNAADDADDNYVVPRLEER